MTDHLGERARKIQELLGDEEILFAREDAVLFDGNPASIIDLPFSEERHLSETAWIFDHADKKEKFVEMHRIKPVGERTCKRCIHHFPIEEATPQDDGGIKVTIRDDVIGCTKLGTFFDPKHGPILAKRCRLGRMMKAEPKPIR